MSGVPGISEPKPASPIFTVGTLRYTQQQLYSLFFWLMWNEFSITLLESVPSLTTVLLKDRGASNTTMALFGSFGGLFGIWINPFFSTWSDRGQNFISAGSSKQIRLDHVPVRSGFGIFTGGKTDFSHASHAIFQRRDLHRALEGAAEKRQR